MWFCLLPAGGGGGKNPLATVASLALMVAVPTLAPVFAGSMGITSAIGIGLVQFGLGLAGNMLIGALFPPSAPELPQYGNTPAASPTYSLQARGNSARLGQPIPAIYGQHRIFPNLAAAPWSQYQNNEQYLHQLFMVGQGEYDIQSINIDDTPIANFAEVDTQIIPPGGSITLFQPDYVTAPEVAGQELLHNVAVGGFILNPADTLTSEIHIDIIAPSGLYSLNDNGSLASRSVSWIVEYSSIDNDGVALGSWSQLGSETLSQSTNTPQRRTYI